MMTIVKQWKTETAHIVREAVSERCRHSVHGHKYIWEVAINGPVKENGMVIDFIELKSIGLMVDNFDHASVLWEKESEEVKDFFKNHFQRVIIMKKNCTAENMAKFLHQYVSQFLNRSGDDHMPLFPGCKVEYVRVWETDSSSAIARDSNGIDILTWLQQ